MTVSSTTTKNSYSGNGSTTVFAYGFKVFDEDDLTVILRTDATGTETVQSITTNYTVSGVGNASGGNVTFVTAPASGITVVIRRASPLTQTTDYTPNDPFPAASHEDALDNLTFIAQQQQEELDRAIKLSRTNTMTSTEFTVGATDRANKVLAFDSSGEISVTQEIGTFQGNWAASTAYAERDLVKDTSTNNIFIVNSAHTSSGSQPLTTNANSAKYDLIVDAAAAATSASAAATSATAAAASEAAASTSETNAAASATAAAASEAGVAADAAAAETAKLAAQAAQTAAETAETNAETAETNAETAETNAAASQVAAASSASSASSSASTATTKAAEASTSATTATTQASTATTKASEAATSATNAATSESNASTSETNAAASAAAAAASFDAFDDIYLGAKSSAPTVDNDGDALTAGDQYFNTTNNTLFVWNGSAWQAASPDLVGDTSPQLGGDLDTNGNDINFGDNDKAIFGAGSDLQLFHDGSNSYVRDAGTGALIVNAADQMVIQKADGTNRVADFHITNGTATLKHQGNNKLATTATGVDVTGSVVADGLTVDGNGTATITTSLQNPLRLTSSTGYSRLQLDNSADLDAYSGVASTGQALFFETAATERMRITSGGNVGIGTSSPSRKLELNNGGTGALVTFTDGVATNFTLKTDGSSVGTFGTEAGGTQLAFMVANSEKMRIDNSGNVLVGKTAPNVASVGFEAKSDGAHFMTRDGGEPLKINRKTSDGNVIAFAKDGTTVGSIGTVSSNLAIGTDDTGFYFNAAAERILPMNLSTFALRDAAIDLGATNGRWKDIYATNATIQTSDANEKQQIAALTDAEITAAKSISALFKTFKWNSAVEAKGDAARTHTGVIAQDVQAAMTAAGLDAGDYAFFISSTWWETQTEVPAVEAVDAVLDEDGNVVTEAVEAVAAYTRTDTYDTAEEAPEGATERTRLGVRYPELLAFIGAATEQRLSSIETRLAALEAN
jgi:hypothetical protein